MKMQEEEEDLKHYCWTMPRKGIINNTQKKTYEDKVGTGLPKIELNKTGKISAKGDQLATFVLHRKTLIS